MNRSTDSYRESRIYGILIPGGILFLMIAVFMTDNHRKVQFEAKAIRTSGHPDAKTIPIIAVSVNAFSDDMEASRNSGMNAHLSKPLDAEQLVKTISRYRKHKSLNKRKVF